MRDWPRRPSRDQRARFRRRARRERDSPDGRPDLAGIWERFATRYYNNVAADLTPTDVQPWAKALYQQLEDLTYRQIHLDGRQLPEDPNPSWMGYSVGRWEGDTLVVESIGFTDQSWLDYDGHPHTEALRMTERYRRRDVGHLDLDVTLEDPGAYNRPWTVSVPLELLPDTELLEFVCKENEKSTLHLTGNPDGPVAISQETLAKYAGPYEIRRTDNVQPLVVSMSGDALFLDWDNGGPEHLVPLSENSFSMSGSVVEFFADDRDAITHLVIKTVEGIHTASRLVEGDAR